MSERNVPFVGAHNQKKNELLSDFTDWRNKNDDKTALEPIYVLFGVSGSGKSRTLDELAQDFANQNVLSIPVTFNDFMEEIDYDYIETELLLRILFSVFIKNKSNASFNQFRKKNIGIFGKFNADIKWSLILNVLEPHFKANHDGIVILLDEILKTSPKPNKINKTLYEFLKTSFNETSNGFSRKDLGIIFTTLNMNEFWKLRTQTKEPIYSYSLPFLNYFDINELSKYIVEFSGDFIDYDGQLSLLLNASQGRPRIIVELLFAKKYGSNLLETALSHTCCGDVDLLYHSLTMNKNDNLLTFNDNIGSQTVAERIMNGTILQPQSIKRMDEKSQFQPIPSILSIFKFMDWSISMSSFPSSPSIYKEALKKLSNKTVKEGVEFEEFHSVFDALKRKYCYNDKSKFKPIDINFNDSKIPCITVRLQDLYTLNAMYFPANIANDTLYIPRINHFGHIDTDFKNWNIESDDVLNVIPFIWTFYPQNEGFDHFYFAFNKNKDLIGIFVENKYSKSHENPSTLTYPAICKKHEDLKKNIKNHLQIKDFYHIFVSTQNVIQQKNINKDNKLQNVAILSSKQLTKKEVLLEGLDTDKDWTDYEPILDYYGACWLNMVGYFNRFQ